MLWPVRDFRYKAFISYSHRDKAWAAWLQRALESYRIPKRLVGSKGDFGPIPRRLAPVFRDREDLSSASDLSAQVKESLHTSESLIVICSPASANSSWVNEEIAHFRKLGREDRIFALIVDGDPQSPEPQHRCFPPALTAHSDGTAREPLAADVRKWADGKSLARLKIIAGILGLRLDDLRRRDMQRRQRMWMASMGGAMTVTVAMAVLAIVAVTARNSAENRREHAEELVGYMVGDLKSKLDEVGRLDILEGVGGRVSEYLQTLDPDEVTDESLTQQAKVWRQLGQVSMDQTDLPGALKAFTQSRDILLELHRRNPNTAQFVYELGNAEFWVGYVYLETGQFDQADSALNDYLAWAYRLNEIEPGNPEWVIEKSYAHSNLATLIIRRGAGDVEQALVHIGQAVEFNQQALELAPDNPTYLSQYSLALAWLADTQLLTCDLGGALMSRQHGAEIARRLTEDAPANSNFRTRYAFALTGLATVARQVGLVEIAIDNLTDARDILGQLSLIDPSNLDLRFEFLEGDLYLAELQAESDQLPEAVARMESIRQPIDDVLESENYSNLERNEVGVRFLLDRSEMAWRSENKAVAQADLDAAIFRLAQMLQSDHAGRPFMGALLNARFQLWQQRGRDLFAEDGFSGLDDNPNTAEGACSARANQVRQAILNGEEERGRELTASLLASGYYEPSFIRIARQYGLSPE